MKKTVLYIVLLALLGYAVYYFVFSEHDAFGADEAGFTVKDTASIGKIFMADKKGRTILLERKQGGWFVNNQYPSLVSPVNVLLATMHNQVAMHPVPATAHNTIVKMLAGSGVKVEVYNNEGDKLKVFYVAGQAPDNEGSYMLMEGATTPYVVQIPGFEGYISSRYSTALSDWRDRIVFNVPAANLVSVSIQYDEEPLNSFVFKTDKEGKHSLEADPALGNGKALNSRRAEVYSKYFENIYCEGFINGAQKLDSLIASTKRRCVMEVTSNQGNKQRVDVYWMPLNKRSKNMLTPFPGIDENYDADRFYAVMNNNKDTAIIQRNTFDKIFRKAWEFYAADDTSGQKFVVSKGAGNVIKAPTGK